MGWVLGQWMTSRGMGKAGDARGIGGVACSRPKRVLIFLVEMDWLLEIDDRCSQLAVVAALGGQMLPGRRLPGGFRGSAEG